VGTHEIREFWLAAAVMPLLVTAACGGAESTASRSAAAYDEAQRKGVAVGKSEHLAEQGQRHVGHATAPPTKSNPASHEHGGHSSKPSTGAPAKPQPEGHVGMDHSQVDHSKIPTADSHASTDAHAGMDHSRMAGMQDGTSAPSRIVEALSAIAKPGAPSATLAADPLDRAPATSIADAARSAATAAEMSGGGHAMSHGTYTHVDAGRDAKPSPKPSPHVEHKH
jgi:hypothetical protein